MKNIITLKELMHFYIQSLSDMENAWLNAIDTNYYKIFTLELKELLLASRKLSEKHSKTLGEILHELGEEKTFEHLIVAKAMIGEMQEILKLAVDPEIKDAAFIVFHQSINHYKIARYGTVSSYAKLLGNDQIAGIIHNLTLEEKSQDELLTKLAESKINPQAKSPLLL